MLTLKAASLAPVARACGGGPRRVCRLFFGLRRTQSTVKCQAQTARLKTER